VKHDHNHEKVGELLKNHPFAFAEFSNAARKGISDYHHEQSESQDSHNHCKPVGHKPTEEIFLGVLLRELEGKIKNDQEKMGNRHERRRQSQSPAVRQQSIEARKKTGQRAERQRKTKTVNRRYSRAFLRGPKGKGFSPDIVVPDEKGKNCHIDDTGNNPLRSYV